MSDSPRTEIVLDIGANIGVATKYFRSLGFQVIAYEPHPDAAGLLARRFRKDPGVTIREMAISGTNSAASKLFLHHNSSKNVIRWSVGASLLPSKPNVVEGDYIEINQADILEVLGEMSGAPIVKMDVEGAEVEILQRLLENNDWNASIVLLEKHDFIGVELTEKLVNSLRTSNTHRVAVFDDWP